MKQPWGEHEYKYIYLCVLYISFRARRSREINSHPLLQSSVEKVYTNLVWPSSATVSSVMARGCRRSFPTRLVISTAVTLGRSWKYPSITGGFLDHGRSVSVFETSPIWKQLRKTRKTKSRVAMYPASYSCQSPCYPKLLEQPQRVSWAPVPLARHPHPLPAPSLPKRDRGTRINRAHTYQLIRCSEEWTLVQRY